jgi:hypothetical protein
MSSRMVLSGRMAVVQDEQGLYKGLVVLLNRELEEWDKERESFSPGRSFIL